MLALRVTPMDPFQFHPSGGGLTIRSSYWLTNASAYLASDVDKSSDDSIFESCDILRQYDVLGIRKDNGDEE